MHVLYMFVVLHVLYKKKVHILATHTRREGRRREEGEKKKRKKRKRGRRGRREGEEEKKKRKRRRRGSLTVLQHCEEGEECRLSVDVNINESGDERRREERSLCFTPTGTSQLFALYPLSYM